MLSKSQKVLPENYKWNIINEFFKKKGFVSHQVDTFNDYINNGVQRVITESDIVVNLSPDQKYTVSFENIYIPKPSVIEEDRTVRPMFPSEARQRDLTYDSPIFVDVIEKTETDGKDPEITVHNRIIIGRTPIMLLSDKCNLKKLTLKERVDKGECEKDYGGYFIIRGKERALVGQLRGVYNQPIVLLQKPNDKWKYVCEVRSMSEETGHSVLLQAKIGVNDRSIVFNIPYIKEIIPVGILFKALGFLTEEDISNIIGNKDNNEKIKKYIKFIVRDSYHIKTQEDALKYISQFTVHVIKDDKKIDYTTQVVENELLPHMGIFATIKEKSYFLGMMVNKLLCTYIGIRKEDDRDNYSNKRVEMAGVLCCELFRTLFKRFIKSIVMQLEKKKQYPDIINIISRTSGITSGLKSCFSTGSWSVTRNNYVRTGVSQVLSRLTFAATLSHLRRVVIPIGKEGKNSKIRQIHSSQIMYICNCVTGDTEVLLGDNKTVKFIKDLKEGVDEIMTINPVTLEKEKSAFYNKFSILPEQIYEIKTMSGRKVKCTPEHPFLIKRRGKIQWIEAKDLDYSDLMCIKHYTKYLPDNDGRLLSVVCNGEILNASIKLSETCARLFALFLSSRYKDRIISFSSKNDMDEVIDDIISIGIKRPACRIGSESSIIITKDLLNFMIEIGFDYSNRFGKSLPKWLIESPSSVKREFISAFQGCNGGSLYYNEEFENILMSSTSICDVDIDDNSQCILACQISEMFTRFNIKNKISTVKKMVNNLNFRNFIVIEIENNPVNLVTYSDIFWFRYSEDKVRIGSMLLEFLKTFLVTKEEISLSIFKQRSSSGIDDIILNPILSIKKNIPLEPVYDLTTISGNHSFMVNSVVGSNCECFDPETPILMWDGSIKMAHEVKVGDYLIDDKGNATKVKSTTSGTTQMYVIKQKRKQYLDYKVTSNHILTLKIREHKRIRKSNKNWIMMWFDKTELKHKTLVFHTFEEANEFNKTIKEDDILDITIENYMKLSDVTKKKLVGFKSSGINWEKQEVLIDPYILGSWLGDGFSSGSGICNTDVEIIDYWRKWASENYAEVILSPRKLNENYNYTYKDHQISDPKEYKPDASYSIRGINCLNPLKQQLKKYNLIDNKHLPIEYLVNDRETRLKVLAGLIDSDGSVRANGHEIRISQGPKNDRIITDMLILGQSLGFSCSVSSGVNQWTHVFEDGSTEKRYSTYRELTLTGEFLYEIPTLLPHKKLNKFDDEVSRFRCSSFMQSSIEVTPDKSGEYVGWQLEGNGRFLLGDCTTVHNTPEGQSIGIVMNLALSTLVTRRIPTVVVKEIIESSKNIIFINDYDGINDKPKIFLNGILMGITENADEFINEMKDFRKNGLLDKEISITFDDVDNEIKLYCDEGRFIRPLLTVNEDGIPNIYKYYEEHKETKIPDWDEMIEKQFVSYVDNSEIQSYVIAMDDNDLKKRKNDLFEICPSMILGVMASGIPFPDHNQVRIYFHKLY